MTVKTCETFTYRIWIGGDYQAAVQVCRKFTLDIGLCVSVQPTDYVYTMGMESGVCVTLINYPRFPATQAEIETKANLLAEVLRVELAQGSFTIQGPNETWFVSHREDATQ